MRKFNELRDELIKRQDAKRLHKEAEERLNKQLESGKMSESDVPEKGWFIKRNKNETSIYLNGERLPNIHSFKFGLDADSMLETLELKIIGVPIKVDYNME